MMNVFVNVRYYLEMWFNFQLEHSKEHNFLNSLFPSLPFLLVWVNYYLTPTSFWVICKHRWLLFIHIRFWQKNKGLSKNCWCLDKINKHFCDLLVHWIIMNLFKKICMFFKTVLSSLSGSADQQRLQRVAAVAGGKGTGMVLCTQMELRMLAQCLCKLGPNGPETSIGRDGL